MRTILAILLSVAALSAFGADFKIKAARDAISQYQRDLKQAELECAKSLEAAAQSAVEKNDLEEAIRIKQTIEDLKAGKDITSRNPSRLLWKYQAGFFERLHDGTWLERGAGNVVHIFKQTDDTKDYIELDRVTKAGLTMRLYEKKCAFRRNSKAEFEDLYAGAWAVHQ